VTPETFQGGSDPGAVAAYEQGRAAFAARDLEVAHQAFERAHRKDSRDPRFMSWYGVTLVLVERNSNLGIVLCDQALRLAGPEPELLLNQARVHLSLNQRERAVRAILRGLELFPDDPRLAAARDAMGTRRPAVIPFLSRNNPLNRILGRLRHRWKQRNAPPYERSPVALGVPFAAADRTEERRS
jgi:tetratricopeptide (TPR) repeat protein